MRIEICDVQLHAPSPKLTKVLSENQNLKSKNNIKNFVAVGVVVVGLLCFVIYVKTKKEMKLKQNR